MRMLTRSRVVMRRSGVKLLHGDEGFFLIRNRSLYCKNVTVLKFAQLKQRFARRHKLLSSQGGDEFHLAPSQGRQANENVLKMIISVIPCHRVAIASPLHHHLPFFVSGRFQSVSSSCFLSRWKSLVCGTPPAPLRHSHSTSRPAENT